MMHRSRRPTPPPGAAAGSERLERELGAGHPKCRSAGASLRLVVRDSCAVRLAEACGGTAQGPLEFVPADNPEHEIGPFHSFGMVTGVIGPRRERLDLLYP